MRATDFLLETGLTPVQLKKHGGHYAKILLNLAKKGPVEVVPEKIKKYGNTVTLTNDTIKDLENFLAGQELSKAPKYIDPNDPEKKISGSWGDLFKSSAFTGREGRKPYNLGHLNELLMGLAVSQKFINQNQPISAEEVKQLLSQVSIGTSGRSAKLTINQQVTYTSKSNPDNLNFLAIAPTKSTQELLKFGNNLPGDILNILNSVVKYVNESSSINQAITKVMNDPNTNIIEVTADGTSDAKGTKADIILSIDGSRFRLLSLKTTGSNTLGQYSGETFEALDSFFKIGFNINLEQHRDKFDKTLSKEEVHKNIFELYDTFIFSAIDTVLKTHSPGVESQIVKQLSHAANIFARGSKLEDVEVVKLDDKVSQGNYKVMQFSDNLVDAMKFLDLYAQKVPSTGKGRTIQIMVRPTSSAGVTRNPSKLCQFRSQVMGGYLRNYFETGEALEELVTLPSKTTQPSQQQPQPQSQPGQQQPQSQPGQQQPPPQPGQQQPPPQPGQQQDQITELYRIRNLAGILK